MAMADDDPVEDVLIEAGQRQSGATAAAPIETESAVAGEKVLDEIDDEQDEEEPKEVAATTPVDVEKDPSEDAIDEEVGLTSAPKDQIERAQGDVDSSNQNIAPIEESKEKDGATTNNLPFPLTRIRNIIKLDKDIKVVARPALTAIALASQQFIESLTSAAFSEMIKTKRKSLRLPHLEAAVKQKREFLDFLDDSMEIFAEKKDQTSEDEDDDDDDEPEAKRQQFRPPPPGTRCITDFFGVRRSDPEAEFGVRSDPVEAEATVPSSSSGDRQQQQEGVEVD